MNVDFYALEDGNKLVSDDEGNIRKEKVSVDTLVIENSLENTNFIIRGLKSNLQDRKFTALLLLGIFMMVLFMDSMVVLNAIKDFDKLAVIFANVVAVLSMGGSVVSFKNYKKIKKSLENAYVNKKELESDLIEARDKDLSKEKIQDTTLNEIISLEEFVFEKGKDKKLVLTKNE